MKKCNHKNKTRLSFGILHGHFDIEICTECHIVEASITETEILRLEQLSEILERVKAER